MQDNGSYEDKGMGGNAILTFSTWQEGLFALMYVMNNNESVKKYGPVNAATDAMVEGVTLVLELIQTIPFLLPLFKIYPCDSNSELTGAGCALRTIAQFWLPANGADFDTFFGIMLALSIIIYAMGAVAFYAASTFHKKDVHFVWPIAFLRWAVRILITTFFISVVQSLMTVFSCPLMLDNYVTSGLQCGGAKHTVLMIFVGIALAIFVPMGIVFGLLHNTQNITSLDPSASVHGRSRAIHFICKVVIAAAYTTAISITLDGDNTTGAFICKAIAAAALTLYVASRTVSSPHICGWANAARTSLSYVFLAVCLAGFASDLDAMTVAVIALVGACVGLLASSWRKAKTTEWARQRLYAIKPRLSDDYAAHLVELLYEECLKAPAQAYFDTEDTENAEDMAASATQNAVQPYNVKDKASVTMVRNLMWIETDVELLFRFFVEEWHAMSAQDRRASKVVINEIFVQVFHTGMFREFALMWYAVISHELFQDYLTSKHFLRVAFESNKSLDMCYLAYQLQKQNETARQAANIGSNATGQRFNLVDLVTFKRYAETAKKNHRKSLVCMQQVFTRLIQTDLRQAQAGAENNNDEDKDEDAQEQSQGTSTSVGELQTHNELLVEAMRAVRNAEASYAALTKAFPKSSEARTLYLQFMKQVLPEEAPVDMLNPNDNEDGVDKSDSSSSLGGLKNASSPKQEYVRDLRSKLASIMRFTTITMWLGLTLMGSMMVIIAGVGHSQDKYLVDRTVENVDALNAIRTSWLGICKFSVEISHFIRVRDQDRALLSKELPPKNTQLLSLLNSIQNTNVAANNSPATAGIPDIVANVMKSNDDHKLMSDGDLRGLQSDWSDQVHIVRSQVKSGKSVNLLSNDDPITNSAPRLVELARSPASQVLKKFHEKYRADKAAGKSSWPCTGCNLHDVYVTDARGLLVGFHLESGNKMQVNTDYAVFNHVRHLDISKNMGKEAEDFDSDPVLQERFEGWNVHALLRLYQGDRSFMKFFENVKRSDPELDQVHVSTVQHSENNEQQLITITVPLWSPQPPADISKDRPIGYVTAEARVLTSDFLDLVLKIQDLVWKEVMDMLVGLAKGISKMVDDEVSKAAEQNDDLKLKAFTDENVLLTYYSGVTQADSGLPGADKLRTDKAWGRSYQTVSFRAVVAEFSNAVVASTANLQTMTFDELMKLPAYRFITETCVREPQGYSLELTHLTTDFAQKFIDDQEVVLVSITVCVLLLNLVTCGAMNVMISKRLKDFELRDPRGLSIAYKLAQEIPIMSKKKMTKRFKQYLRNGTGTDRSQTSMNLGKSDTFVKALTNGNNSPPTTDSPQQEFQMSPRGQENVSDHDNNNKPLRLDAVDLHQDELAADMERERPALGSDQSLDGDISDAGVLDDDDDIDFASPKIKVKSKSQGKREGDRSPVEPADVQPIVVLKQSRQQDDSDKRGRPNKAALNESFSGRSNTRKVSIADKRENASSKSNLKIKASTKRFEEELPTSKSPRKKANGKNVKQPEYVVETPVEDSAVKTNTWMDTLKDLFIGWTRGYLRRWVVILWAALMIYSAGLLSNVLLNFYNFGTFCEDLALAQQTHFYFRNACTRVMDTVTYERMPWRTDSGQQLREDFDMAIAKAEESLQTLINNKDLASYEPRQKLLYKDYCMLDSGNCGKRTGWEAYKNPELMERGLYRAALVWFDHVKELRREYADTKLPQSYINSTHPPEFWFVRDSIAYDLAPGLFLLIQTYIDEAVEKLPDISAGIWSVAGGGLACVVAVSAICVMLMQWQWGQIADALTALRVLPWEDVQNQTVLTLAKIADQDGAEAQDADADHDMSNLNAMQPGLFQGPGGMQLAAGDMQGNQIMYVASPPSGNLAGGRASKKGGL